MLVLERKLDEAILIGGDILVTVLSVKADKVKLGVAAPVDIPVFRAEVADRIARRDPRKSIPSMSPHRDDSARYRNALHLVVARGRPICSAEDGEHSGVSANFTQSEWKQIKQVLAGGMEVRS